MLLQIVYASSVSGGGWTNASNAAGSPSAGSAPPYASIVNPALNSASLIAAFPATVLPGTLRGLTAIHTGRGTAVTDNSTITCDASGLLFSTINSVIQSTFTQQRSIATGSVSAFAETIAEALAAGTFTLDTTFASTLEDTLNVKGIGLFLFYDSPGGFGGMGGNLLLLD